MRRRLAATLLATWTLAACAPGAGYERPDGAIDGAASADALALDAAASDAPARADAPPTPTDAPRADAPRVDGCVPRAEACNGLDDDCDGVPDDGLAPRAFCSGRCVDTSSDAANCGACGRACAAGQTCVAGACGAGTGPAMLRLVNEARATSRMCGTTSHPAVPPLTWDARLEAAALAHTRDMVAGNFLGHTGSDGSTVGTRVTRQMYAWSAVGENVARGQRTVDDVMRSWLGSPGHCRNIMSANFTQMGSASLTGGSWGTYWTQVFARPR